MTKPEAIQDAKDRVKEIGLGQYVIRIKTGNWLFNRYTYDTVTEHHFKTHMKLYESGHFKKVYICKPELNLKTTSYNFSILSSKKNANLNIPNEIKSILINRNHDKITTKCKSSENRAKKEL